MSFVLVITITFAVFFPVKFCPPCICLLLHQLKVPYQGELEDGEEDAEEAEEEVHVQGGEVVDGGQVLVAAGDQRHHGEHDGDAQAHLGVGVRRQVERQEGDNHHEEAGQVVAREVEEELPTDEDVHQQLRMSFPVFIVVKTIINSCFLIRHLCSLSPTVHLLQDQFKVADEGVLEDGDEN
ncbi:hypothetical protein TYRP_021240 [Tyrophagus putrescentiae]|nr:hypothetical protein TYRP_021240 [Tyrophagus putrescentiae]